ncbi:MAG: hypothetical protein HN742_37420 [Lentisphaerae bacterium]|jgi:DNA repair photolyase|nr:hypothetical protein [Lentisphaerota bacterium]MBT4816495.1 hypothetical protein [Lentisphaerota bacterium]MBT5606087.1 hypothetical protein [Lentisphaerota bacterium]MBT7058638.1 hypothetical protein [Lentisphaerota bacterium]MBT7847609.1 hypothetical protein [Lentisphaerota bacterium]
MASRTRRISGTREWAPKTANCIRGCAHDCRYCYAKSMAIRFKRKTSESWRDEEPVLHQIDAACKGKPTRVMFPSTHDITPSVLLTCLGAIRRLLAHGHELLIVSKPHFSCIDTTCQEFLGARDRITFRFTIGSARNDTLEFWEPHAPTFEERLACLQFAFWMGFETSVSCEPMLDDRVKDVVDAVTKYVSDSIWIGKANQLRQRLRINGADAETMGRGDELLATQTDDRIRELHSRLADNRLIRWKDSIRDVMGIRPETQQILGL